MKPKMPLIMLIIIVVSFVALIDQYSVFQYSLLNDDYYERGTSDSNYVELEKISGNIWMHTTYSNYKGSRTPSNGIIAVTSEGIVLVDTPWNNEQTEQLIIMGREIFDENIIAAVITHAHEDRIGGIGTLIANGVEVISTKRTEAEAEKLGFQKPKPILDVETFFSIGDLEMEVFYPGEGHTVDNIIVWFPKNKVLFGGCLIKSMDSENKGNVEDANLEEWSNSVLNVMDRYADATIIIPGHGKSGNSDLLGKTWELVSQ